VPPADPPTVTLTVEQEEFWRRCFGRLGPDEESSVVVEGDDALGRRVLGALAFMT
jgi:hypothetical protein